MRTANATFSAFVNIAVSSVLNLLSSMLIQLAADSYESQLKNQELAYC
jgi:hypothetical protein